MKKEKQIIRSANSVLAALRSFKNILMAKGKDFDSKKIDPIYSLLEKEVSKQAHGIIAAAKIPDKPRKAKDILADIAKGERLTSELLQEAKRSK